MANNNNYKMVDIKTIEDQLRENDSVVEKAALVLLESKRRADYLKSIYDDLKTKQNLQAKLGPKPDGIGISRGDALWLAGKVYRRDVTIGEYTKLAISPQSAVLVFVNSIVWDEKENISWIVSNSFNQDEYWVGVSAVFPDEGESLIQIVDKNGDIRKEVPMSPPSQLPKEVTGGTPIKVDSPKVGNLKAGSLKVKATATEKRVSSSTKSTKERKLAFFNYLTKQGYSTIFSQAKASDAITKCFKELKKPFKCFSISAFRGYFYHMESTGLCRIDDNHYLNFSKKGKTVYVWASNYKHKGSTSIPSNSRNKVKNSAKTYAKSSTKPVVSVDDVLEYMEEYLIENNHFGSLEPAASKTLGVSLGKDRPDISIGRSGNMGRSSNSIATSVVSGVGYRMRNFQIKHPTIRTGLKNKKVLFWIDSNCK